MPIAIGVAVGSVASGIDYLIFYAWSTFSVDALRTPTLFFIFAFTGLALSYFLVHLLAWYRTPKSSFHTILEAFHLTPQGMTLREASVKTASAVSTAVFGGSAGPEGPAAVMGGGLSIWLSRVLKTRREARRALLIGVAAGFSASFRTPLTGAIFALELPYRRDLEIEPFIEAAIASSVAYLVSVALNSPPLLPNPGLDVTGFSISMLPVFMAFGLITAGVVYLFTRAYHLGEALSRRLLAKGGYPLMLVVGGIVLGAIGYLCPSAVGPGYQMVPQMSGQVAFLAVALILLFRPLATIFTMNFGGAGGLFLPTIIIGGTWGSLVAILFAPSLLPVFVLMGMASFSAGVHKMMLAPIIFIAEVFGAHTIIPVILSTVVCYFITTPITFYHTQPLSKTSEEELALERFYYKVVRIRPKELEKLKAADIMTPNPIRLRYDMSVRSAFEAFSKTPFRLMPVVDERDVLLGHVKLEELASLSKPSLDQPLRSAGLHRSLTFKAEDGVVMVIETMIEEEADHAFVVDDDNRLTGIISSIDIVRLLLRYYARY